ncbi:MAG: deoxyribodipyrimidine photo-lyase, partial [Saprospiraceae bacterium]
IKEYNLNHIFSNRDYEPSAILRDNEIKKLAESKKISFIQYKDQVIFESLEISKSDNSPYTVFTPYKNKWLTKLTVDSPSIDKSYYLKSYPTEKYFSNFAKIKSEKLISIEVLGFVPVKIKFPLQNASPKKIINYDKKRDYPCLEGTTKLGMHFRFGTISIREKARKAASLNLDYLNELIWRDFYSSILQSFPHVVLKSFKPSYDRIEWRNNIQEFDKWCQGMTGFPIIDAGMRELNGSGFMHNRVRMITASFLVKNLLIDWRWGETYFAEKLLDYELASNNGGWQWAAGSGTDAAPYFRIFNPITQQNKFDGEMKYIKRWIPEINTPAYPEPMINIAESRVRCLHVYKNALYSESIR